MGSETDVQRWRGREGRPAAKVADQSAPTQDAYDATCKALAHWRKEAKRLGKIAGVTPREMKHT